MNTSNRVQLTVYVDANLIQAVKNKEPDKTKGLSASGVVDWLLHKFLNPDEAQP